MKIVIGMKLHSIRVVLVCISIASFLQWLTFQLFVYLKLGSSLECFALAQTLVVLVIAPYLAASMTFSENHSTAFTSLLVLSPISIGKHLLIRLTISLIPIVIWVILSTFYSVIIGMSIGKALKMLVLLGLYSFTAGTIGMWSANILTDPIFGSLCTYLFLSILIGSAFLFMSLERYINDLQPYIQPILHLNPLIAVCNINDGMDIFRTPLLYERTPITSHDFSYPSWIVIGCWQLMIGFSCFFGTLYVNRPSKFVSL